MKRLIIDFDKDGTEYVYRLYHPFQDSSDGYIAYTSDPTSIAKDLSINIVEYLPKVPHLEDRDKEAFQESDGYYLIHQSKLQSYDVAIQSALSKAELLEEQLRLKETNHKIVTDSYEARFTEYRNTISAQNEQLRKLEGELQTSIHADAPSL